MLVVEISDIIGTISSRSLKQIKKFDRHFIKLMQQRVIGRIENAPTIL